MFTQVYVDTSNSNWGSGQPTSEILVAHQGDPLLQEMFKKIYQQNLPSWCASPQKQHRVLQVVWNKWPVTVFLVSSFVYHLQVARRDIFCEFASRRSLLNKAAVTNGCRWMQETWSGSPNGKPRTLGFRNYKSNSLFELDARDFCKGGLGKAFPSGAECCQIDYIPTFPFFTVGPPWMLPHHLPISRSFFFAAVTMSSAAIPAKNPLEALARGGSQILASSSEISDTVIETYAAHPKYPNLRRIISKYKHSISTPILLY